VAGGELGDGDAGDNAEEGSRRRRRTHELNPDATLESNPEALNVKKFDLAFTVDPLFHKTSAQFDEGGAKGGWVQGRTGRRTWVGACVMGRDIRVCALGKQAGLCTCMDAAGMYAEEALVLLAPLLLLCCSCRRCMPSLPTCRSVATGPNFLLSVALA